MTSVSLYSLIMLTAFLTRQEDRLALPWVSASQAPRTCILHSMAVKNEGYFLSFILFYLPPLLPILQREGVRAAAHPAHQTQSQGN